MTNVTAIELQNRYTPFIQSMAMPLPMPSSFTNKAKFPVNTDHAMSLNELEMSDFQPMDTYDTAPAFRSWPKYSSNQTRNAFNYTEPGQPDNDLQNVPVIEGVILLVAKQRTYYNKPYSPNSTGRNLVCFSPDYRFGLGTPGGNCGSCRFQDRNNQDALERYGRLNYAQTKKLPACERRAKVFIKTLAHSVPVVLSLSEDSNFSFFKDLADIQNANKVKPCQLVLAPFLQAQWSVHQHRP